MRSIQGNAKGKRIRAMSRSAGSEVRVDARVVCGAKVNDCTPGMPGEAHLAS